MPSSSPNCLNRFLALTGIVLVVSGVSAISILIFNAPHDAYAGAVYAKIVPIFFPLYAIGIFSVLWFIGSASYTLFLRKGSPTVLNEQWHVAAFFCVASFLLFITCGVTAYGMKRHTDTFQKWDSLAKSSNVDLKTFKPLVDEYHQEFNPQRFEANWRHQILAEAAYNPTAQADFLSYCIQQLGGDTYIMNDVAENTHTPETALRDFYKSRQMYPYLAANPSTPPDILKTLANSDDPTVRGRAAANPHIPQDVLEQLTHDKESWIRSWAAQNLAKRVMDSNR